MKVYIVISEPDMLNKKTIQEAPPHLYR